MGSHHSLIAPDGKLPSLQLGMSQKPGFEKCISPCLCDHIWVLNSPWSVVWASWCHPETRRSPSRPESTDSGAEGEKCERKKKRWNLFSLGTAPADSQSLCCSSLYVPHLAVSVVFGLCFIEDGKRPSDDQAQFLMESQEKAPFISVILSSWN